SARSLLSSCSGKLRISRPLKVADPPRCPHAMEICSSAPPLEEFTPGRLRACFKPVEELL
ncbi:hypothetical protein ACUOFC_37310, partial [Escherichia sp. TWPC-MK]